MKLKDKTVTNESVVITDEEVNVLGPDLMLNNCEIISNFSNVRCLILAGVEMTGGTFFQKKVLADYQWDDAIFKGVTFKGQFLGCDFGNWDIPDYIDKCDFTETSLSDCRFLNCDISRLSFPRWPCFTIPYPSTKAEEISKIEWPDDWKLVMRLYADNDKKCSAIIGNVDDLIAENGGEKEDLKKKISTISGVIM